MNKRRERQVLRFVFIVPIEWYYRMNTNMITLSRTRARLVDDLVNTLSLCEPETLELAQQLGLVPPEEICANVDRLRRAIPNVIDNRNDPQIADAYRALYSLALSKEKVICDLRRDHTQGTQSGHARLAFLEQVLGCAGAEHIYLRYLRVFAAIRDYDKWESIAVLVSMSRQEIGTK